jgi:hypothetical protein
MLHKAAAQFLAVPLLILLLLVVALVDKTLLVAEVADQVEVHVRLLLLVVEQVLAVLETYRW